MPEEREFEFEDGSSEHLLVTRTASNLYRLAESSALDEARIMADSIHPFFL
jgi:hypothetical protein